MQILREKKFCVGERDGAEFTTIRLNCPFVLHNGGDDIDDDDDDDNDDDLALTSLNGYSQSMPVLLTNQSAEFKTNDLSS